MAAEKAMRAKHSTELHHYHPKGMYFWDSWYLPQEDAVHAFHLQVRRPDGARRVEDEASIGHAVSRDLLHWHELPVALRRGHEGSYDCGPLYTGCTVWHEGIYYLFYTGNGPSSKPPWKESICLSTSPDGIAFRKYGKNPIIEADGIKWKEEDVRDIMVKPDPEGRGWLSIVVMRLKDSDQRSSLRWVLFRSLDLYKWKMDRVVFSLPGRYNIFEVPDFFPLGDKWYVVAHNGDGSGSWSDPGIFMGTFVGQAEGPSGPYSEVKDNLIHKSNDYQGFSGRTFEWNGERLMLYGRNEGIGNKVVFGRMSWPLKLAPRKINGADAGLLPLYWHGCDKAFKSHRTLPPVSLGSSNAGVGRQMQAAVAVGHAKYRSFMIRARVTLLSAERAGFALPGSPTDDGVLAFLDSEARATVVTYPKGKQKILWNVEPGGTYIVRLVVVREMIDLFVNEELVINCFTDELMSGAISYFVEGGEAEFSEMELWTET